MKDMKYAEECDKLSKLETQNHTSWGRWFVCDGMLSTWVCVPKTGYSVVGKMFCYEREISNLKRKVDQDELVNLLEEKFWIGLDGLHDLQRAFKFINKHGVESENRSV